MPEYQTDPKDHPSERVQSKRIEEMPETLRWNLRSLGAEFGPLAVALAAAEFTDKRTVVGTLNVQLREPMTLYPPVDQRWNPKLLIETLCQQQTYAKDSLTRYALEMVIDLLKLHRPEGPNGKHGDRHTPTCGCEDNPILPNIVTAKRGGIGKDAFPFIINDSDETETVLTRDTTINHDQTGRTLINHLNS